MVQMQGKKFFIKGFYIFMKYISSPDPTTNSETTNPNFHEFVDQLQLLFFQIFQA